ncbi:MAG: phage holin family protein [Actinomycetota bacterium]|nr:phage holin family protein [Actinomycetota bacterium]
MAERRPNDKSIPNLASELWDLVRAYAKQETIEPAKGLGRFLAFGLAGSVLLGIGTVLLVLAVLRVLQDQTGTTFDGNWSWAPYLITLAVCLAVVGAALSAVRKKGSRP